jgi:hypothetical protein
MKRKSSVLFVVLGGFFVANALMAEFVGVKIFSLEAIFDLPPADLAFFGESGLSFNLTAGVLLWPVVFLMTDVINEYYGRRGVRLLSFLAAGLVAYAFIVVRFSMELPPAEFWIAREVDGATLDMERSFDAIFGQGLWIIVGSLAAFLIGQLVDVVVFQALKRRTGEPKIWLRATGSTLVSQLVDSFVVLMIAFYIGAGWSFTLVLAIAVVNYAYKFVVAALLTPLLYVAHYFIDRYLGEEEAARLRKEALSA